MGTEHTWCPAGCCGADTVDELETRLQAQRIAADNRIRILLRERDDAAAKAAFLQSLQLKTLGDLAAAQQRITELEARLLRAEFDLKVAEEKPR